MTSTVGLLRRIQVSVSPSPQSTENLAQLRLPFDNVIGVYPHCSVPNLPFQVPPELFPFEHRFMEFDGNCIHYIDEGTGQTLLLLHGNPSWCFLYRKIVAGLKPSFRCVALDFPGYGMSDAPAGYGYTPQEHAAMLEQFVDRLNLHLSLVEADKTTAANGDTKIQLLQRQEQARSATDS